MLNKYILAIVTLNKDKVAPGGVPTFYCDTLQEQEKVSLFLSKITNGMVHDLENGVYLLVRH